MDKSIYVLEWVAKKNNFWKLLYCTPELITKSFGFFFYLYMKSALLL
jgi:hypothetical protein